MLSDRRSRRRSRDSPRPAFEPLEGRRMLAVGATVPWTRYEAEAGSVGGAAVVLAANRTIGDPAGEASGRQAVTLAAAGDSVSWTVSAPGNALVLRASIPDAPRGGGLDGLLEVRRNGSLVQLLPVTSRYAWVYGDDTAVSNDPEAGPPRRIYDESSTLLSQQFEPGDTLTIQFSGFSGIQFCHLDFVELEQVAPLSRPANSLSIVDQGAVADDGGDDTAAIVATIAAAKAQGKSVWIPAGQFRQSSSIQAAGVTIAGAGMWFSEIWGYNPAGNNAVGFNVTGGGTVFRDFRIRGEQAIRAGGSFGTSGFFGRFGTASELRNIWIEHVQCGAWVGIDNNPDPATNLVIDGLRIRNTFADGVNLCNGTVNATVTNSTARNTGDDAFAAWSVTSSPRANAGNVFRNNTAENVWKAAGFAVYGGADTLIENNLVTDTLTYPGITIAASFSAMPFQGTTAVQGNSLVRCGGVAWGQEHGAIWIYVDDADIAAPIVVADNLITDSTYTAFEFNASNRGKRLLGPATFTGNTVIGGNGLAKATYFALGSAAITDTRLDGSDAVANESRGGFALTVTGTAPVDPGEPATDPFSLRQDVGSAGLGGSDSFDPISGTHTVSGSGADIWYAADAFRFVSQQVTGDVAVVARVTSQTATDPWAKAGLMIRAGDAADARFAGVFLTPANGIAFQWRSADGIDALSQEAIGVGGPRWLKLTRVGGTFSAFQSSDGVSWSQVGSSQTLTLPAESRVGLAVTAHNAGLVSTATFRHVLLDATPVVQVVVIDVPQGRLTQAEAGFATLGDDRPVIKTGSGTLVLDAANPLAVGLTVRGGSVALAHADALAEATVTVEAGATLTVEAGLTVALASLSLAGRVDLGSGRIVIASGGWSPADLAAALAAGSLGGGWNGSSGIVSSAVAAAPAGTRTVGFRTDAGGLTTVAFAAFGDTDLSGSVNVFDLVAINASGTYGSGRAASWSTGDMNQDGLTTVFDLVAINGGGAYNQGSYLPPSPAALWFAARAWDTTGSDDTDA